MAKFPGVCWIASIVWLGIPAKADVVTFDFAGVVTQVPVDEAFGDLAASDPIQGSFRFDTSASDLIPMDPATGSYSFSTPFGMTAAVGAHEFDALGSLNIGILNSFVDQYSVLATSASGDLTLELLLQDNTGEAFGNDHLPATPPPLVDFSEKDFHLIAMFNGQDVQTDGQLSGFTDQVVPEPSLIVPVLAGMVFTAVLARWRGIRKSIKQLNQQRKNNSCCV